MASLAAHLSAALFLVPIGVRRLLCSSSVYIDNPSLYRSRTWYLSETKWKNFDIYSLILLLPIAAFSEIFLFLAFSGNPTYKFAFSHQSMAIFFFWALTILIILRENFDPLLGTWMFQIGLSLYTDAFALKGCRAMLVLPATQDAFVQCDLEEDQMRGIALMNLIFIGHAFLVLILGLGLIGLLSSNKPFRCREGSGPLLAEFGQETMLSSSSPEIEME
ncbi:uncharacterized protein LOC111464574 isoform X3 [Cucurbita moschata]|uniref:Uncharacterized protein LOC111464574 isoform X3 n=1 Tax=Cucurbita moschata TaxID=3662 RepID=A0A6J1HLB6_CUCMO|nr:uncharacterized protein LOC111464574 isoform X3 [Cucurbita moschata]